MSCFFRKSEYNLDYYLSFKQLLKWNSNKFFVRTLFLLFPWNDSLVGIAN